jgi:plasmid maintenance system antidote protein VapI
METPRTKFAEFLQANNVKIREIAYHSNITEAQIRNLMSGKHQPSIETAIKLYDYLKSVGLDVDIVSLFRN